MKSVDHYYELAIPDGEDLGGGYVALKHKQTYRIRITNSSSRRTDAETFVDGKHVGTFRIDPFSSIILERPTGDTGKFTFLKTDSAEAVDAQIDQVSKDDRGVIKVNFKPEKVTEVIPMVDMLQDMPYKRRSYGGGPCGQSIGGGDYKWDSAGGQHTNSTRSMDFESGGTGLTGESNQKFRTVKVLDYDEAAFTTVAIRLVTKKRKVGVRPLKPSPVIPAPVD